MKRIQILDCTLRDGGYINDWKFGKKAIKSIISKLQKAQIDIIECGFLTKEIKNDNYSLFNSTNKIQEMIGTKDKNTIFVAMIAIGEKEIDPATLPPYDGTSIDGIRLTFHKEEFTKAIHWAQILMEKNYKVFMQPVGTISYSDIELLNMIEKINALSPFAFYIVDTLGSMYKNELLHIFYLIDKNLNPEILVGFHAHNNLQLAFSNAQELSRIHTQRKVIIDTSIYGMGRAAGNLPTELFTQYVNKNISLEYDVPELLDIYDKYVSLIHQKYDWGYAIPYHIAAKNICHPNYASFLINKQTLTMKDIENIIISIPEEEKIVFNQKLVEQLYINYQNRKIDDTAAIHSLRNLFYNKPLLILAPGKSLTIEYEKIYHHITTAQPHIISINFWDNNFPIDTCFVSNHKRVSNIQDSLNQSDNINIIATSNIQFEKEYNCHYVNYYNYLNLDDMVFDNAGLMLLNLLKNCDVKEVTLAGFDGFKYRYDENYYNDSLVLQINESELNEKQTRIKEQLKKLSNDMTINFLTSSLYER